MPKVFKLTRCNRYNILESGPVSIQLLVNFLGGS